MTEQAPGPGRPSGDDRRNVRGQLLSVARKLFTRHGFEAVSMRRLAREAGVTPAMIHYYFGDKHGLYRALLEEVLEPRFRELEALAGEGRVTIEGFMNTYIAMFRDNPWMPRLVFREVLEGDEGFRRQFAERVAGRIFPFLAQALREETATGRLRADLDPVAVVISVMSQCVYPFLAAPLIEAGLKRKVDAEFVERYRAHAIRLVYEGLRA
jgi:AcrR family transcriptional regulator